jgi:hypothetical protein
LRVSHHDDACLTADTLEVVLCKVQCPRRGYRALLNDCSALSEHSVHIAGSPPAPTHHLSLFDIAATDQDPSSPPQKAYRRRSSGGRACPAGVHSAATSDALVSSSFWSFVARPIASLSPRLARFHPHLSHRHRHRLIRPFCSPTTREPPTQSIRCRQLSPRQRIPLHRGRKREREPPPPARQPPLPPWADVHARCAAA